jgi:error-prone DNA polymerase
MKAAEKLGIPLIARGQTWQMVEKFIGFGFCKAHAATYADLAYRMAYLKAHYPAEFLAAMCSSGAGFYHVSAYVEEAKRWGIAVRLPSVNHSRLEYTTEPSCTAGILPAYSGRSIRIGLMQVKGLRLETIENILRSRDAHGPYRSLEDFLARVPVERDEIESLIKCGAFDEVCAETRPSLLWRLNLLKRTTGSAVARVFRRGDFSGDANTPASEEAGYNLFPAAAPLAPPGDAAPALPDYTREQRLAYESAILEVCVSGHPLDLVARNGENWSTEIEQRIGQRVTLLGWLVTFRHVATKNYRNMMFATMEDQRGLFEVVLFPPAYERCGRWIFEARMLRVTGRVEQDGHVNCEHMEPAKVL